MATSTMPEQPAAFPAVTIGNVVGDALMVGVVYRFVFLRRAPG